MKTNTLRAKLLNCFFAFTLVFGLCIPSIGSYAYAEPTAEPPADNVAAHVEGNVMQEESEQTQQINNSSEIEIKESKPTLNNEDKSSSADTLSALADIDKTVTVQAEGSYETNGIKVEGGAVNVDFVDTGSNILVKTSKELTISGTSSTYGIQIEQGVKADIVLAGVNLTGSNTFEVLTNQTGSGEGTLCHITLKDGSTNILKPGSGNNAPLRCGTTSTLIIDDENLNIRSGGSKLDPSSVITPQKGRVGFTGKTLSGIDVNADDDLSVLESDNPGELKAYAPLHAAAIGGSPCENSGILIFNGGKITAMGSKQSESDLTRTADDGTEAGGAGIGAGNMANGTTTIFNGGEILAKAAFHGSGIGGGYCNGTYHSAAYNARNSNATVNTREQIDSKSVAGNITINGGYIRSYGSGHGNAFGQACCGTNNGKTITVTGGTLLPWSNSGYYDIGGSNGNVIITGGSIRLTGAQSGAAAPTNKFQSGSGATANKAYNDKGEEIFMFCIDLSTSDHIGTEPVAGFEVLVNGFHQEYGAPSYFDEGKLYLWLPKSAAGKNVTVKLNRYDENGNSKPIEDLTATPDAGGASLGKRWIQYSLTDEFKSENASLFNKYYDGNTISQLVTKIEEYVEIKGLPAPYSSNENAVLKNKDKLLYQAAPMNEDGSLLAEYSPSQANHDHQYLPDYSGNISLRIESNEFAQEGSDTAKSFWGHETKIDVTVWPVNSKTSYATYKLDDETTINGPYWVPDDEDDPNKTNTNHLIVPVDITSYTLPNGAYDDETNMSAVTCKAPYGALQLYIDGRAVPASLGGRIDFTQEDLDVPDSTDPNDKDKREVSKYQDADEREHSLAVFDLSRAKIQAFGLDPDTDDNNHTVYVKYTSSRTPSFNDTILSQTDFMTALEDEQEGVEAEDISQYRNYYDSQAQTNVVKILTKNPKFDLYNLKDQTSYDPTDVDNPTLNEADQIGCTQDQIDEKEDLTSFFYEGNAYINQTKNWFPLYVDTNSAGEITFESSNPGVISFSPNTIPNRAQGQEAKEDEDFGCGTKAVVTGAGLTTITVKIAGTGNFNSVEKKFDVYIYPDPATKPVLTSYETAVNTTRNDGSIRANDTLTYTQVVTNTTANSAFQNPVFTLEAPKDTTFAGKVVVTKPDGEKIELENNKATGYTVSGNTVTIESLPALYGNQSYRISMDVTVNPDTAKKSMSEIELRGDSKAEGVYGINPAHDAKYPWDTRIPGSGNPVDPTSAFADPTSIDPNKPLDPERIKDILGGGVVDPSDPGDNPGEDPDPKPGLVVVNPDPTDPDNPADPNGELKPDTPFGGAKEPLDPDNPKDPSNDPIKPGDRIIKFGDKDDPKVPEDIAEELEKKIKEELQKDSPSDHVDIPVVIQRDNPDNPDNPIEKTVIVTVPIDPSDWPDPKGTYPNPDDPNDHDLVVIPDDVDPRVDGDITTTKTMENITDGFDKRKNKSVALVGDTIRYTITVENTKAGSAWYSAIVKDPLPKGLEYIPGTTKITLPNGQVVTDFETDYTPDAPTIGFCLGDIYGGEKASVSFEVKVAKGSQTDESQSNIAYAYGTEPSDTLIPNPTDPTDPDDPDNPDNPNDLDRPIKQVKPDTPVGPYDPTDEDKTWDDIDEETKKDIDEIYPPKTDEEGNPIPTVIPGTDPTPTTIEKIISSKPKHEELRITLSAQNETRTDGYTYVGDLVTYTIDIENLGDEDTNWLDVIARADIPQGLNFIPGSIVLTTIEGEEISVSDAAYNNQNRILALNVGNIPGGKAAKVVFRAEVTLEAINKDIGMTAHAYGTMPDEITEDYVAAEPGTPFVPEEGWALFERDHFSISNTEKVYPSEKSTVLPKNQEEADQAAKLAKTGDITALVALGVGVIAVAAGAALVVARRRMKKNGR